MLYHSPIPFNARPILALSSELSGFDLRPDQKSRIFLRLLHTNNNNILFEHFVNTGFCMVFSIQRLKTVEKCFSAMSKRNFSMILSRSKFFVLTPHVCFSLADSLLQSLHVFQKT